LAPPNKEKKHFLAPPLPVRVVNMPVPARAAGKQASSKAKPVIKAATA